jgi:hypothetical protein
LLARGLDPLDPVAATEQVRQLRERIKAAAEVTLEEELKQIFADSRRERNREMVIGYYGWNDGQLHTLAEIGRRYGVTRERTRQICANSVKRKNPAGILAPVIDRTLALVAARLPRSAAELERQMSEARLTAVGLRLEHVVAAAGLLGRPLPFCLVAVGRGRLAVAPEQAMVPPVVVESAQKEVFYHGTASVAHMVDLVSEKHPGLGSEVVEETLRLMDGFHWLDRATGWFRLACAARHGLPLAVEKVLAVAGRVRAADLARAIGRSHRIWETPPPPRALLEFCRQMPFARVESDWIIAASAREAESILTGGELQLFKILREHGPVMRRRVLEQLCVAGGMNRFSLHTLMSCSPVVIQHGPGVYGLLGAKVPPGVLKSLLAKARAERSLRAE